MRASGTKVDELYLQLSLDMDDLEKGVAGADKKISDLSKKLNTELNFNKLKAEIELLGLDEAENGIKGLQLQFDSLTTAVEIQSKRVEIAAALHAKAVKELGENGKGVRLLEEAYLREEKALAKLEAQLRQTAKAQKDLASVTHAETTLAKIGLANLPDDFSEGDTLKILNRQYADITRQITVQELAVKKLSAAYRQSIREYGEAASGSKRLSAQLAVEKKNLELLERQLTSVSKARQAAITKIGETVDRIGDSISAPLAAAGLASLRLATDAVESENLFEEAMGNMAAAARAWSQDLRKNLGLNEYELRKSVGMFYTMFESIGLTTSQAYELATGLTQLAQDMASFYNIPTEAAFEKLRSGITGEAEPLKQLGIIVNETTTQMYAYTNGIAKQGAVLTEQEKVLARYAAILDQTKRAQGDLARTLDSPSNQLRIMREEATQLGIELGQNLIPLLKDFLQSGKNLTDWYNSLSTSNKEATNELVKLGMEVAAVNTALAGMGWAMGITLPWWGKLAVAIALAKTELEEYSRQTLRQQEIEASRKLGQDPDKGDAIVRLNIDTGKFEKQVLDDSWWAEKRRKIADMLGPLGNKNYIFDFKWVELEGDELEKVKKNVQKAEQIAARRKQLEEEWVKSGKKPDKAAIDETIRLEFDEEYSTQQWLKQWQREQENAKRQELLALQKAETLRKTQEELTADIIRLTKSETDAAIYELDRKAAEYKEQGIEQKTIDTWLAAEKKRVVESANRELNNKIAAQNASALQVRLREIEQERQAYIRKTGDEVKATQWAEKEKINAVKNAALDAIRNHQKELELINKVIEARKSQVVLESIDENGNLVDYSAQFRRQVINSAMEELMAYQKEALNLPELAFKVTPEHLELLQASLKSVEESVLSGMVEINQEAITGMTANMPQIGQTAADHYFAPWQSKVQQLSQELSHIGSSNIKVVGANGSTVTKNFQISIPITVNATIHSDADLEQLADKVAVKIEKPLVQAIQGADEYAV